MKRLLLYFILVCTALGMASVAEAIEPLFTKEGVEVTTSYYPLGPNNQIAAYVRFVNNNSYKVDGYWHPVITCEGGQVIEGAAAKFSIDAKSAFEVTLWRSMACGLRQIKNIKVQMTVNKSTGF